MLKVSVHHWRFEDGLTIPNPGSRWELPPVPRGWYCWAYTNNDEEFEKWMARTCPTADICHRFNGGNPMYTTFISNNNEALLFQLAWNVT